MNLKEMREMVGSILDYAPNVEAYNIELNRIINESYLDFYMLQPWTFCQKTLDVYTTPDATQNDLTIEPRGVNGYFRNFIENVDFSTGIGQAYRTGQISHEGSLLKITGSDEEENNGIFSLDKLDEVSNTAWVSKISGNAQRVDWKGTTGVPETITGTAFQRYLNLPKDCSQILSVGIRNMDETGTGLGNSLGHMYNVPRSNEEQFDYRFDITGTPTMFFVYDQNPNGFQDVTHFVPRAKKDFSVDVTSAGGTGWPIGTYEFKMAYHWHGIEGPLSDAFQLDITEAGTVPRFNTLDTSQYGVKGLRKKFYVRIVSVNHFSADHEELFFRDLSGMKFDDLNTDFTWNEFIVEDDNTQLAWPQTDITIDSFSRLMMIPRLKTDISTRMRIRLHPRPTSMTPITIRYISYPMLLVDDQDQPEAPIDTHRYIVYRALAEMLFKHNQDTQSAYYEKKAEKELQKIEERYLTQRSAIYIKDSFRTGPLRLKPYRTMTKALGKDGQ